MPTLQFQPLSSQPTPSFWSALNTLKLDHLRLDDTTQSLTAWIEEGREIPDREQSGVIGVDGSVGVGGGAFGVEGEKCVASTGPS
jgi:ubiquitin-like modifier-activating enzyme ATG7